MSTAPRITVGKHLYALGPHGNYVRVDRAVDVPAAPQDAPPARKGPRLPKQPNATELAALDVLRLKDMAFEGRTFDVPGGGSYTCDWYGGGMVVEVKGQWVHQPASIVRFHAARSQHPELTWIFARKLTKGKRGPHWHVEIYEKKH